MVSYKEAAEYIKQLGFVGRVPSNVVLVQEALKRGIEVSKTANGRAFHLQHNGRSHWWRGGNNSLNTRLSKKITQYKSATNALLYAQGISTTRSFMFEQRELPVALKLAELYGPLVLKPDDSQGGRDVFLEVETKDEFSEIFSYIADKYNGRVLIEPFYKGEQVRFLFISGEVAAISLMRPANVIGDGRSNIGKLVRAKNRLRKRHPSHDLMKLGENEVNYLRKRGLDPESVPKKDERIYLSSLSNLQQGGDSVDITDDVSESTISDVKRVVRAIPGLRVAGVDVLLNVEKNRSGFVVLEVNCSPQLSIHHFPWEGEPRNVAAKVIDAFFPASPGRP